jgi:hypothetical protein
MLIAAPKRLMSEWILSLEPERRRTIVTEAETRETISNSVRRSSCLRLQLFCVETFLLFPKCQSNGRDLPG